MDHSNDIHDRLSAGQPLRIVFLNDIGFGAGAGIALKRQVCSFLKYGHFVSLLHAIEFIENDISDTFGSGIPGNWLGSYCFQKEITSKNTSEDQIASMIVKKISDFNADLVITGNFHGARIPSQVFIKLREQGIFTVAYLHDCYWFTGHCAYYGDCNQYIEGCSRSCPKPDDYPSLEPSKINGAWQLKRDIFTGEKAIPCAANSSWLKAKANEAFKRLAKIEKLPLGLDHMIFSPSDKIQAKKRLGIPTEGVTVLFGSYDMAEARKNHSLTLSIIELLQKKGIHLIAFGKGSEKINGLYGQGYVTDSRQMAELFNASDIFLGTSGDEAFGQTLLEASSCGVPIVAINSGGVSDIARDGENALLIPKPDQDLMLSRLEFMAKNAEYRACLGNKGRKIVETEFSLEAQYVNWHRFLCRVTQ